MSVNLSTNSADLASGVLGAFGRKILVGALALSLSACGVTYKSPSIRDTAAGQPVTVVEMTRLAVQSANASPYTPRALPAVFYAGAGTGSIQGAGALPAAPYLPNENRRTLEYRPLPDTPATPYRIGVGDQLLLATKSQGSTVEQLTGLLAAANQRQGYTVRGDGTIAIPEIGAIEVSGLTQEEAENRLFQALVNAQIDPTFSLEISQFNSQRVAVGGAVRQATVVPITPSDLTLGEALIAAGGPVIEDREFASIRVYRDGTLYQIPYETYVQNPGLKDRLLRNGDAVFVDTTYDLDRALTFYRARVDVISLRTQAKSAAIAALNAEIGLRRAALNEERSNFERRAQLGEDTRDYVYLAGEVASQSRVALPYGRRATLADVLFEQGGVAKTTGDPSQIYVVRDGDMSGVPGELAAFHLNAVNAANLVRATEFEMRPNDVIFVEEQPITKWSRALNQLFPTVINRTAAALQ
ncbi:polysaccharide biosynthesis/export family protein [Sagittula sp. SSi028]|uniref:polysaccharide biosynthesis/export family protein n=1 Tax=Sagittula sp. SSi028 TaxID=3400636 RepID=UPI003AF9F145